MLTERIPAVRGFGQRRFIVRGTLAIPESVEGVLRPRVDEYPERYPLDPGYPQAGRRGGSRPPSQQGGAPAAAGAPAPEIIPVSIYPVLRVDRKTGNDIAPGGFGTNAPSVSKACYTKGHSDTVASAVPIGATQLFNFGPIPFPFRVEHVTLVTSAGLPNNLEFRLFVSSVASDGTNIPAGAQSVLKFGGGSNGVTASGAPTNLFPGFEVNLDNQFIIAFLFNNSAAIQTMQISFDYTELE
jgi:hypothetical protein